MNADDLADLGAPNCERCLHPLEATGDGWECVYCAVEAVTEIPQTR